MYLLNKLLKFENLAIIFDFNGTMFFDSEFQEIAWRKYVSEKCGREITDEEFKNYIHGRNADFTLGYFLKKSFSRDEIKALEEEKEIIYRQLCLASEKFLLAPGLIEFLDEIKDRKIPINIATASGLNNVKFFFEHLKLDKWFDIDKIVYNDGSLPGKPAPDLYLKAAEQIGVLIENCIIFEDSVSGIEAGLNAGARGVIKVMETRDNKQDTRVLCTINNY